jgi:hypothetical protein
MDFIRVVFCGGQKAENSFTGLFNHLKRRFIDITKVAFCDIQIAEDVFAGRFDHLNHHFIDFTKSYILRRPEGRL